MTRSSALAPHDSSVVAVAVEPAHREHCAAATDDGARIGTHGLCWGRRRRWWWRRRGRWWRQPWRWAGWRRRRARLPSIWIATSTAQWAILEDEAHHKARRRIVGIAVASSRSQRGRAAAERNTHNRIVLAHVRLYGRWRRGRRAGRRGWLWAGRRWQRGWWWWRRVAGRRPTHSRWAVGATLFAHGLLCDAATATAAVLRVGNIPPVDCVPVVATRGAAHLADGRRRRWRLRRRRRLR